MSKVAESDETTAHSGELSASYRDAERATLRRRTDVGGLEDDGRRSTIGELIPILISHEGSIAADLTARTLEALIEDLRIFCQLFESASETEVNDNRSEMTAFLLRMIYRAKAACAVAARMPAPQPGTSTETPPVNVRQPDGGMPS